MNPSHLTGLGSPQPIGKRALFQSPEALTEGEPAGPKKPEPKESVPRRVRTTIDLTGEALKIIQGVQQEHRLRTGKVLPLWKAVSQAIEAYGNSQQKRITA